MKKTPQDYKKFMKSYRRIDKFLDCLFILEALATVISFIGGWSDISLRAAISVVVTIAFGTMLVSGKNKWIEDYDHQHSDRP